MMYKSNQKGMTLVEVMIALVLASLVILAVINLFIGNSRNYRLEEGISRTQENGRFALDILNESVRGAGNSGCRHGDRGATATKLNAWKMTQVTTSPAGFSGPNDAIQGFESGAGVPAAISTFIEPNTDAILVRKATSCGASLTLAMAGSNANIQVSNSNTCNFNQNDIAVISNCKHAHVFEITNTPAGSGLLQHNGGTNQADNFCRKYPVTGLAGATCTTTGAARYEAISSEVMKIDSVLYYIRRNDGGNGPPSLYEYNLTTNNSVELVEGVDDLQIQYGIDDVGAADRVIDSYADANTIAATDWQTVVGIKFSVLMASIEDNIVDGPATTIAAGKKTNDGLTVTPVAADNQLRRVFSSTIGIRNALP